MYLPDFSICRLQLSVLKCFDCGLLMSVFTGLDHKCITEKKQPHNPFLLPLGRKNRDQEMSGLAAIHKATCFLFLYRKSKLFILGPETEFWTLFMTITNFLHHLRHLTCVFPCLSVLRSKMRFETHATPFLTRIGRYAHRKHRATVNSSGSTYLNSMSTACPLRVFQVNTHLALQNTHLALQDVSYSASIPEKLALQDTHG